MSTGAAAPHLADRAGASTRHVYLDRFRIGLTVLVVLHHVAMAYGAGGLDFYYVVLPETFFSRNLLVFVLTNQAWFMVPSSSYPGTSHPNHWIGKARSGLWAAESCAWEFRCCFAYLS